MTRIHSIPDEGSFFEPGKVRPIIVSAERQFHSRFELTRETGYGVGRYHGSRCRYDHKSRAIAYAPHRSAR